MLHAFLFSFLYTSSNDVTCFRTETVNINKNIESGLHIDGTNAGESAIITFGTYTSGGELWIEDENIKS